MKYLLIAVEMGKRTKPYIPATVNLVLLKNLYELIHEVSWLLQIFSHYYECSCWELFAENLCLSSPNETLVNGFLSTWKHCDSLYGQLELTVQWGFLAFSFVVGLLFVLKGCASTRQPLLWVVQSLSLKF